MNQNGNSFYDRMQAAKIAKASGAGSTNAAPGHAWKRHYESRDDYRLDLLYRELLRLESWLQRWRETEAMCLAAVDIALNGEPYAD